MKVFFAALLFSCPALASACSVFYYRADGGAFMAKSFELERSVKSFAVKEPPGKLRKPSASLSWVSRYGSITIRLRGATARLPGCGMNDQGLVCEAPLLGNTLSQSGEGQALNELEYLQYQLDNFATVEEVAAHAGDFRIEQRFAPLHYMCCDRKSCLALELGDSGLSAYAMAVPAMTNVAYESAEAQLKEYAGFGGDKPVPSGFGTFQRYVRAAAFTRYDASVPPFEFAMHGLDSLFVDGYTRWQVVYDLKARRIHIRRSQDGPLETVQFD